MHTKKGSPGALRVRFQHMAPLPPIKELVRQRADRLHRYNLSDSRCEVVVGRTRHGHNGTVFGVSVRLDVPGKRSLAVRAQEKIEAVGNLQAAVRLAFNEIERQLRKREKRNQAPHAA